MSLPTESALPVDFPTWFVSLSSICRYLLATRDVTPLERAIEDELDTLPFSDLVDNTMHACVLQNVSAAKQQLCNNLLMKGLLCSCKN
jgi:hypothetical protein